MTALRKVSLGLAAAVVVGIVAIVVFVKPQVDVGVGYTAKQVCSCVYVGQRPAEQCLLDLGRDISKRITLVELTDQQGIKAEVFPLANASAFYHPGSGCTIE